MCVGSVTNKNIDTQCLYFCTLTVISAQMDTATVFTIRSKAVFTSHKTGLFRFLLRYRKNHNRKGLALILLLHILTKSLLTNINTNSAIVMVSVSTLAIRTKTHERDIIHFNQLSFSMIS